MDEPQRVALCVTCIVDQLMPEIGQATVKVLQRAGFQVDFPEQQTCCGQPFFNSGFRRQAINLARRTIEIFEEHDVVVLPSGSCTTMIRIEYPHLLEPWPEWHQRAQRLASKTYELSEFLEQVAAWPGGQLDEDNADAAKKNDKTITYHDSCHMCRLLHLRDEPRRLLTGVGYSLHEMDEPDRCCGFGGLFSLRMPEVSNAMTAEKLRQANETGADVLVTADPGCLMQMRGLLEGDSLQVRHIAAVLEEATR